MAIKPNKVDHDLDQIKVIKNIALKALVSNDALFDLLVLKGGNAIEHIGLDPIRQSLDLDFSLDGSLTELGTIEEINTLVSSLLTDKFNEHGFKVFDIKIIDAPKLEAGDEVGSFWSGYKLTFKVIRSNDAGDLTLQQQRMRALTVGKRNSKSGPIGTKSFEIDMSNSEYCSGKIISDVDGYKVHVYSGVLLVCEKIRAICQQMDEYREIIPHASQKQRARDFFDIHYVTSQTDVVFSKDDFISTLKHVFDAKNVPLNFLGKISECRDYHRDNFDSVIDTVASGIEIKDFDFYVDYLVKELKPLETLWIEDSPSL